MTTFILKSSVLMKKQLLFVFLLLNTLAASSQEPVYQPSQMQADLKKFKNALEYAHPGMYAHTTPEAFQRFFDQLLLKTNRSLTGVQFNNIVMELVAAIHDGHTRVFANGRLRSYINQQKLLPFHVLMRDQRIFITRNLSSADFADGSEIIAINGNRSDKIIMELMQHFGGDGLSNSALEYRFGSSYNSFYRVFPLLFGFDSLYNVTIRDYKTKQVQQMPLMAVTAGEFRARELAGYGNNLHADGIEEIMAQPALTFSIRPEYGILKINRFFKDGFEEPANTFPDLYKDVFRQINDNKVEQLVIDLRGNGGGIGANAASLVTYLTSSSFVPTLELSLRGNGAYYKQITEDSLGLDSYFALKRQGDYYIVTDSAQFTELKKYIPANQNRFNGKIYVLIDGGTLSAAGAAAGMLRAYTNSVFIGTETGGYAGMSNGIRQLSIRGDSTEITINLPLIHGEFGIPLAERKRGVVPDYQITPSIHDLIKGKDTAMDFVINRLIKKL
ncbi:MAG: hypothetical protein KIT80_00610 [Chitinophagaceae bacterium]|nr:hypothetical protein [Chitinophagaceae bacterium]MCW5925392.1 hypothetical protein [Chitinophagaceae bacterium]